MNSIVTCKNKGKLPALKNDFYKKIIPVIILQYLFIVSIASAGVITGDSLYSENCYMSPGFDLEVELYPDIVNTDGVLAKDQKFTAKITGDPGSEVGVWLYMNKAGFGNPDRNVFAKFSVGSNGELEGDGTILDDDLASDLPSGRYYLYFVSGDSELVKSDFFPDSNDEFDEKLAVDGSPYLKLEMYSEVPWIRCDQKPIGDIISGDELRLSGTTNIAAGKDLIISIGPTAFDDPYFKDQIIERTTIVEADPYSTWEKSIETSELGPGEYMLVIEGSDVNAESVMTFNVYDENYLVAGSGDNGLVVQSYAVDPDTKGLSEAQATVPGMAEESENSGHIQQSPVGIFSILSVLVLVICIVGCRRRVK